MDFRLGNKDAINNALWSLTYIEFPQAVLYHSKAASVVKQKSFQDHQRIVFGSFKRLLTGIQYSPARNEAS